MKTQLYNTILAATLGFALVATASNAATVTSGALGDQTPERTINSTGSIAATVFSDSPVDGDANVDSTADITIAWEMTIKTTTITGGSRRTFVELGGGGNGFSVTWTGPNVFVQSQDLGVAPTSQIGGNGSGDTGAATYVVDAADLNVERSWVASLSTSATSSTLRLFVDGEQIANVSGVPITDWAGNDGGGFFFLGGGSVLTDAFTSGTGAIGPIAADATANTATGLRLYEATTVVGPVHSWIAGVGDDNGGDSSWNSVASNNVISMGSSKSLIATGIDNAPFAYNGAAGNNGVNSDAEFGGTGDATFETLIRVGDLVGNEIIWEVGGTGNGSSLLLEGSKLQLSSQNGAGNRMTVDTVLGSELIGEWLHIVGVITESGAGDDTLQLFVNGASIGIDTIADGSFVNWAGASPWGLGSIGSNFGGPDPGGVGSFTGDIALFNHYDVALSRAQVIAQAQSFGIPAPAALPAGLLMIVGLAARRRR